MVGRGHAAAERQHVHDLLADPGPHVDADPLAALDRPRHAHHERLVPPGRQRLHPADHAGEQRRVLPFPAELEQERMAHEVELDPVVVEAQDLFRDPDHVVPVAVHRVVERPAHPPRDRLRLVDGAGLADEPVGVLGLDGVDAPAARRDRFGIGVVGVVRVVHAQREEHLHPAVARAAGDDLGRVVAGLQERLQVAPRPPVVDVQKLALGGAMVLHPEGPPLPAGPHEVQPVGRTATPDVGVDVGADQRREQLVQEVLDGHRRLVELRAEASERVAVLVVDEAPPSRAFSHAVPPVGARRPTLARARCTVKESPGSPDALVRLPPSATIAEAIDSTRRRSRRGP